MLIWINPLIRIKIGIFIDLVWIYVYPIIEIVTIPTYTFKIACPVTLYEKGVKEEDSWL